VVVVPVVVAIPISSRTTYCSVRGSIRSRRSSRGSRRRSGRRSSG